MNGRPGRRSVAGNSPSPALHLSRVKFSKCPSALDCWMCMAVAEQPVASCSPAIELTRGLLSRRRTGLGNRNSLTGTVVSDERSAPQPGAGASTAANPDMAARPHLGAPRVHAGQGLGSWRAVRRWYSAAGRNESYRGPRSSCLCPSTSNRMAQRTLHSLAIRSAQRPSLYKDDGANITANVQ